MTHATQPDSLPRVPGRWERLVWLPVPVLTVAIVGLWVADLRPAYESYHLLLLLNCIFTWLATLGIAYVAAHSFLVNGQPGLVMLGSGSLLWGGSSMAASALLDSSGNLTVTVHNLGVCGAALCYLGGFLWRGQLERPGRWLAAAYTGVVLAVALLVWAATAGWTPIFFIQDQGGTVIRQVVLLVSIAIFALVAWLMLTSNRRLPSAFFSWYGLGLALVAVGLTGVLLQAAHGSILGWTGRFAQYLGGVYLFIAAVSAARTSGMEKISLAGIAELWFEGMLMSGHHQHSPARLVGRYALAVMVVAAAMGLRLELGTWVGAGLPPYITFYPAMMVILLLTGLGPGILATLLMALSVCYWILPPIGQFTIASPVDRLALVIFTGTNLLVCVVAELYHRGREKAAAYERETALHESDERFRAAFDSSAIPMSLSTPYGRLLKVNEAYCLMFGYSREELLTLTFFELTHPDDLGINREDVQQMLSGATSSIHLEKRYIRKDGRILWGDMSSALVRGADGQPLYMVTHVQDITERKQSEEQSRQLHDVIAEEKDRLSALVNSITDEIWFADMAGQFIMVNPAASHEFALSSAGGIDVRELAVSLEVLRPDGSPRSVEEAPPLRAIRGEVVRNQEEQLRIPTTGELRWRQVNAAPVRNFSGTIIGSVAVVRDITEQKQAEEQLRINVEELRTLNNDLSRFNKTTVGRELRMIELKKEINELCVQIGQQPRYPLEFEKGQE
jgi:PAS domain S-box-containing protein